MLDEAESKNWFMEGIDQTYFPNDFLLSGERMLGILNR